MGAHGSRRDPRADSRRRAAQLGPVARAALAAIARDGGAALGMPRATLRALARRDYVRPGPEGSARLTAAGAEALRALDVAEAIAPEWVCDVLSWRAPLAPEHVAALGVMGPGPLAPEAGARVAGARPSRFYVERSGSGYVLAAEWAE